MTASQPLKRPRQSDKAAVAFLITHRSSSTEWTNWKPASDWTILLPNIRSAALVAIGLYEFVTKTTVTAIPHLLATPYISAYLFVVAERRFIAWKHLHAFFHASYEIYSHAVSAANAGSIVRDIYEDVFGLSVHQPGALAKTVAQCMLAFHNSPPLSKSGERLVRAQLHGKADQVGKLCVGPHRSEN